MNAPLVQKSSVAAAEIDQPKFADILQMDESVPARHFRRFQHNRIRGSPSDRTTAPDRMAGAIDRFQPGTFLWGCAHAEGFYQKVTVHAKLRSMEVSFFEAMRPQRGVANPLLPLFDVFSVLIMHILLPSLNKRDTKANCS